MTQPTDELLFGPKTDQALRETFLARLGPQEVEALEVLADVFFSYSEARPIEPRPDGPFFEWRLIGWDLRSLGTYVLDFVGKLSETTGLDPVVLRQMHERGTARAALLAQMAEAFDDEAEEAREARTRLAQ